jgi:uncharacterized protein (UPF0276 family)
MERFVNVAGRMAAQGFLALPRLGIGISSEPGSAHGGIDALELCAAHPGTVDFLEYGSDIERGLDDHVRRWAQSGKPTTYHFLDVNLEEPEDVDDAWLAATGRAARTIGAAWLCGDAGLWHFGARDRGQQLLLPPVLSVESADAVAHAVARVREASGLEVLPENPPGELYLGDLHLLDFFARVSERAGCGLLLDCAHLGMYQRLQCLPPTAGLDGFPLDRVIELHVAGGTEHDVDGLPLVEDSHVPEPLADTWEIFEAVLPRATNLKAIVYECERNTPDEVLDNFARIHRAWRRR